MVYSLSTKRTFNFIESDSEHKNKKFLCVYLIKKQNCKIEIYKNNYLLIDQSFNLE